MKQRDRSGIAGRRGLLLGGLAMVGASTALATGRPLAAAGDAGDIEQPAVADLAHFMARAQAMKALAIETGDQAYGAVVVREGRIVGQAPSRVVVNHDPTAHAETEAIRDAARRLGTADLSGCQLISTSPGLPDVRDRSLLGPDRRHGPRRRPGVRRPASIPALLRGPPEKDVRRGRLTPPAG